MLARLCFGVALSGAVAAGVERFCEVRDEALVSADAFASVESRRLRYRYTKTPGPAGTLILVSGMDATLEQWGAVTRALGGSANVLAYDRNGMGFSEAFTGPNSAEAQARELLELMEALDIPRPRLVVTYSSSALMGRELAERHRAKLDGVFFLDPYMPEALLTEERWRIEKLKASTKWASAKQVIKAVTGLSRAQMRLLGDSNSWPGLTEEEVRVMQAAHVRSSHRLACYSLLFEWSDVVGPPLSADRWGSFPIFVLSTALSGPSAELHAALAKQSTPERLERLVDVSHVSLARENSPLVANKLRDALLQLPARDVSPR